MTLLAWSFVGYGVVAMFAVRPIAGALAWRMYRVDALKYPLLFRHRREPTGEQWFGAIVGALVIVVFWPAAAVFVAQGRRDTWTLGDERIARLEAREARVREMENELGIVNR